MALAACEMASVNWMLFCGFPKMKAASGMVFATG
jgi:hypothetical protein